MKCKKRKVRKLTFLSQTEADRHILEAEIVDRNYLLITQTAECGIMFVSVGLQYM